MKSFRVWKSALADFDLIQMFGCLHLKDHLWILSLAHSWRGAIPFATCSLVDTADGQSLAFIERALLLLYYPGSPLLFSNIRTHFAARQKESLKEKSAVSNAGSLVVHSFCTALHAGSAQPPVPCCQFNSASRIGNRRSECAVFWRIPTITR